MPAHFGVPELIIADPSIGGFAIIPESYRVEYSNRSFTRVELSGIMDVRYSARDMAATQLKSYSLIDLMDEVSRRIKSGENRAESMRRAKP